MSRRNALYLLAGLVVGLLLAALVVVLSPGPEEPQARTVTVTEERTVKTPERTVERTVEVPGPERTVKVPCKLPPTGGPPR